MDSGFVSLMSFKISGIDRSTDEAQTNDESHEILDKLIIAMKLKIKWTFYSAGIIK
jgi:hypothetical protein